MKTKKLPNKKIKVNGKSVTADPIENGFAITETLKYEYGGANIGGLLLKQNKEYKIVFGFHCEGITNVIAKSQIDNLFDPLEDGLKDFPQGETITMHQGIFADSSERIAELEELVDRAPTSETKFFIMGEIAATKKIDDAGERKETSLDIYITYTPNKADKKNFDFIDSGLEFTASFWNDITGNKKASENANLKRILENAYVEGYERYCNLLSIKLGLTISPHTRETIWNKINARFTNQPTTVPQTIHIDEEGLSLSKTSNLHPISHIFAKAPEPETAENYVKVKDVYEIDDEKVYEDRYIGVLNLMDKAEGWKNKIQQLRSMWEIASRPENRDMEIICQLELGNIRRLREDMQDITEQATTNSEVAAKSNKIDVASEMKKKRALEAQEKLYDDIIPFYTSTVFLVHRPDLKTLNSACNNLIDRFRLPLQLYRESVYSYRIWQQTIPICWEKLMHQPYDRRWSYTNDEVPGILPIVMPYSKSKQGIEFLSKEGNVPIYLDLWQEVRHMILLATNRAGKGVLAARIVSHHLARGIPVSILDYPRPDGTSTFSYMAEFLGHIASYFNTAREAFNIFEIPDLSRLSREDREIRMNDFKEYLIGILQTMVVGTKAPVGINTSDVETILTIAVDKFYSYDNLEIHQRFTAAYRGGFGSPEWEETPVLQDFINMLGPESLKMSNPTAELLRCLEFVKLRLNYWLKSRIGHAISRPSTVKADDLLVVYAMANLNSDEDAAVLALAIQMQTIRKSMEHPESVIFVDEVSILIDFNEIAKAVARLCANGAKSGIQVLLSGQDIDSIAKSTHGSKILENIPIKLIGRLESTAIDSIINKLKYPAEIISQNASKSFNLQPRRLASSWLLDENKHLNIVDYCADPLLMALVANKPKEVAARQNNLAKHPDDKYLGLLAFANEIEAKCKSS